MKNIKMLSAFVTRAVRFVIFKTAVFAMEWVKPSVKSAFWGIIFFYEKILDFKVESHFEMICKYYFVFRNFDIDFLHLWFIIRQKVSEGVNSVTFKPQSDGF